jgi:hypothetical protein
VPLRPLRGDAPAETADFYAAAVYGSIVAASLVTASRQEHASPEATALALISTLAVFWLAHVWCAIVGDRLHRGTHLSLKQARRIARAEWPLVEAAFAPAVVLLAGWAGALAADTAARLAIAISCLELFGWGVAVGRRAYARWRPALLSGLVDGLLGIALVSLELVLVH